MVVIFQMTFTVIISFGGLTLSFILLKKKKKFWTVKTYNVSIFVYKKKETLKNGKFLSSRKKITKMLNNFFFFLKLKISNSIFNVLKKKLKN